MHISSQRYDSQFETLRKQAISHLSLEFRDLHFAPNKNQHWPPDSQTPRISFEEISIVLVFVFRTMLEKTSLEGGATDIPLFEHGSGESVQNPNVFIWHSKLDRLPSDCFLRM